MSQYMSLFAGAGGMDLGLMRVGLKPGLVTDEDRYNCDSLKRLVSPTCVLRGDIHDLLNSNMISAIAQAAPPVLVAGEPPLVGPAGSNPHQVDPDGDVAQLMYRFMEGVAQTNALAFIMGAVPTLTSGRWMAVLNRIREAGTKLGYDVFTPVLDGADYGLPQHKARLFVIGMPRGCRPDISRTPKRPKVSAGVALRAAARDREDFGVRDIPCPAGVRPSTVPAIRNTAYSGHLLAGPGRMLDLNRVAPAMHPDLGGGKTPVLDVGQLEHDEEPWIESYYHDLTVLNRPPLSQLPPEARMRRLSVRECAALQGLPANHPFTGNAAVQFRQAGEALPPVLAEQAARAVMDGLT